MRVEELAEIVSGRVAGHAGTQIERIGDLINADQGEIAYVEDEKLIETAAARSSCSSTTHATPRQSCFRLRSPALAPAPRALCCSRPGPRRDLHGDSFECCAFPPPALRPLYPARRRWLHCR